MVNGGVLYDPATLATLPSGATAAIISGTVAPLLSEVTLPDQAGDFLADGYAAIPNAVAMSAQVAAAGENTITPSESEPRLPGCAALSGLHRT